MRRLSQVSFKLLSDPRLLNYFNRRMLDSGPGGRIVKLKSVQGYNGRCNDVLYCHPVTKTQHVSTVVYFGGDIQDFLEHMESQQNDTHLKKWNADVETSRKCMKWNLDNVALLLGSYFPENHVLVVRPARIELNTYSCFDNFVPSNNCGIPEHTPTHYALHHLERLLKRISDQIRTYPKKNCDSSGGGDVGGVGGVGRQLEDGEIMGSPDSSHEDKTNTWWTDNIHLDKSDLILIGFSKGCVVLNQFLYEFHYLKTLTPDDEILSLFVSRISEMYWLDGGHGGDKNTWITSRCLLETLARLEIKVRVHVTPYQVRDDKRIWIGAEEKVFCELLRSMEADITETLHFETTREPTLSQHFQVLQSFKT